VKFAAIAKYRHLWPLSWMCEVFEVTRAGFYAWLRRPPSARERLDIEQTVPIRASFADSDQTYGARRVRRDLRDWGHRCGIHRIERLMGLARLEARPKRRRLPFDLGTRCEHAIAPNVLDRRFDSEAPNNKWVADFTYLWTAEGWALRRRGIGSVVAPSGRLVHEFADDIATRHRCNADGHLATRPGPSLAESFGPGFAVHKRTVSALTLRTRRHLQHEPQWKLLGHSV
jgi:HTH-like domain